MLYRTLTRKLRVRDSKRVQIVVIFDSSEKDKKSLYGNAVNLPRNRKFSTLPL